MKDKDKRITVRFNEEEEKELELLKAGFTIDNDSEAIKLAVAWVNSYIKNVTKTFFPANYDIIIQRKRKGSPNRKLVY